MEAVPLGFALFLLELAVGGILVTAVLDWDGEVSTGFLSLNAVFLAAFAAGAVWLRSILPVARLLRHPVDSALLQREVAWWVAFTAFAVVQVVLLRLGRRLPARIAGSLAGGAGIGALAMSAGAYRAPEGSYLVLLTSLLAGALALGTVWSGMMLGHWYLVTPRLAPRPLLRLTGALAAVLVAQGLFVYAQSLGSFAAMQQVPQLVVLFWLRTGVGVVFPLALCFMVWRTARVRSMMSATGLLYIALGTVLVGEIIAKALYFI
ncbi:MAG: hypothetical protein M3442_12850, partial [Chloroflexota bacterium]|nr:hypothetical protein [Chloroflexota bacterium]